MFRKSSVKKKWSILSRLQLGRKSEVEKRRTMVLRSSIRTVIFQLAAVVLWERVVRMLAKGLFEHSYGSEELDTLPLEQVLYPPN